MNSFNSFKNSTERIVTIDALRGFALLGLFLVHCSEYFELYWLDPKPSVVHDVIFFLFAGKSYAIFALLFGLSFYLILEGENKRGNSGSIRFLWRLFVLFFIGFLHSLVYAGDILQVLSSLGIVLWASNRLSTRWVMIVGVLFLVNGYLIYHFIVALLALPQANEMPMHWKLSGPLFEVFSKGTLTDCLKINVWDGSVSKWYFYLETGRLFQMVGLFLVGLWIGRIQLFYNVAKFGRHIQQSLWISIGLGIFFYVFLNYVKTLPPGIVSETGFTKYYASQWLDGLFCLSMVVFWVLIFIKASGNSIGKKIIWLLAPAGRMSLTLYVAQSLICVPIYYGWGLGCYKNLDQIGSLVLGIVAFSLQLVFAHNWMSRFRYGPLEWLWRSVVYFRWVKIR